MALDLAPGARIDRFVVTRALGEGGMGTVVEAHDPELGRAVALKVLRHDKADTVRLLREAQALATLAHPNVVSVYELGTHEGEAFIAMELVEGVTLDLVLAERPHPWPEIVALFLQAGRGLAAVHERGMVHRDFKPSNVLVDRGGRVRVSDFGLACRDLGAGDAEPAPGDREPSPSSVETVDDSDSTGAGGAVALTPPAGGGVLGTRLTRTGAVLGTPLYMAPEQHAGQRVTHRADQYAFCVSLRDALAGGRPGAAAARPIPAPVRAILERGLADDPAARHPSMTALLAALERALRRRRGRRIAAAIGGVTLLTATAAFWFGTSRGVDPREAAAATCAASAGQLGEAWDAPRRAAVEQAFGASKLSYAVDSGQRVIARLDAYAAEWKAARVEACTATHVERAQSEALLDLRVQCLAHRRNGLAALASALASPLETPAVDQAVSAAHRLPLIADCARPDHLQTTAPLPAAAAERARVEHAHRAVADVVALIKLGRHVDAEARLTAVTEEIGDLDYPPLQSEVAFQRGWFAYRGGKAADAEAAMGEALRFAVAARDLVLEERAWRGLFIVVSTSSLRRPEAEQLERVDAMAIERLGRPFEAWADHRNYGVMLRQNTGSLEDAEKLARATVAEMPRDRFWARGVALDQHARILSLLHRSAEAIAVGREALELWETELGAHHPKIAHALVSLGRGHRSQGDLDQAEAALRRALEVLIAAHGKANVRLGDVYKELAWVAAERRDLDATRSAVEAMLRAYAPLEQGEPANWINGQNQAGGSLRDAGAPAEAVPYLRRGLARATEMGNAKDGAIASFYLGQTLNLLGQPREALARCVEAEPTMTKVFGASFQGMVWQCRADALTALGRTAEAVKLLEDAVALAVRDDEPDDLATFRFSLARAWWAHGDRRRALELADQAAAAWTAPHHAHRRAEVEAWKNSRIKG